MRETPDSRARGKGEGYPSWTRKPPPLSREIRPPKGGEEKDNATSSLIGEKRVLHLQQLKEKGATTATRPSYQHGGRWDGAELQRGGRKGLISKTGALHSLVQTISSEKGEGGRRKSSKGVSADRRGKGGEKRERGSKGSAPTARHTRQIAEPGFIRKKRRNAILSFRKKEKKGQSRRQVRGPRSAERKKSRHVPKQERKKVALESFLRLKLGGGRKTS